MLVSLLVWSASAGAPSALHPAGVQAERIAVWWNVLLVITTLVWSVVAVPAVDDEL